MSAVAETTHAARIMVKPGLYFDEIITVEQCDIALDELIVAVPSIEHQIEIGANPDPHWLANARHALRVKRMLMPKMQELRGRLKRERKVQGADQAQTTTDRVLIKILKEIEPEAMWRAKWVAHQRHPDMFEACDPPPARAPILQPGGA